MIGLEKEGGLWTLTLQRADKANSLTGAMLERLVEVAESLPGQGVKALVLTGEGKVFSAGADLAEARTGLATSPLWERLSTALAAAPCLTIAA
ncbi:MAG TPA: enoyl-CoA hydratase/isomerase family protein, partial [Paracoccaceae bacterium]|nr:enoyl-CoA hydratase/isomerase family protein [Paracoccaceae bacterium]